MTNDRIVVIGAGALGMSSAYHLSDAGCSQVTVLEQEHIAAGSSSRSVGIVETQYMDAFDIHVRAIGRRFVDKMAADEGLHFTHNGYLRLADTDTTLERYATSVEIQREYGITDARVLTQAEVAELVPDMRVDDRVGGLFGPSDGYLDGHLLTSLYYELAQRNGVKVLQRTKLLSAERSPAGGYRLTTTNGVVEADIVVNAAGAWAQQVGDLLGAPSALNPQRHQASTIHTGRPLGYQMPCVMDYVPGSGRDGLYFRYEKPTELIAGLHAEETLGGAADPDSFSQGNDPDFAENLAVALADRLPGLEQAGLGVGWAGLYPMSPDHQPVVGPHPTNDAVICALGAGGNGIQLSPAIGQAVTEFITTGKSELVQPGTKWDSHRAFN